MYYILPTRIPIYDIIRLKLILNFWTSDFKLEIQINFEFWDSEKFQKIQINFEFWDFWF